MKRVLFVCLGNICRSPMAEAVFRNLVEQEGLATQIKVDSAGTGDWHLGKPPHAGTRRLLDNRGIGYDGMKARQVSTDDYEQFDYIICMDSQNEQDVKKWLPKQQRIQATTMKFMDLLPERGFTDVPDPYYTDNFDEVYELVESGCKRLLLKVKSELAA
ncbi:low molecular weight protein-tyrosine-phosphatase [Paenibacillus sp. GCM10012307]|uniref:protein-tyrosine-phosphatase n=1 Tax=Paenibacillus roseus TaxID=2798579 RepID=A0A934JBB1_9BACL|nr:low molecular weight protein-tyrosine-phosphatase [Paenibacillus roseus]MBJ6363673.1 low molecular weight phosphotyrosine protein phosphatase [Paenibacillus roseus]